MSLIDTLIDKRDTFEIVRDRIAQILADETANQMQLAAAAGKDPEQWRLKIYAERSNPWEGALNDTGPRAPLVNVWYDGSNFDASASNIAERQKTEATYNIDCYGFGTSGPDGTGGHVPGDKAAAMESQRALRLARNILAAAEHTYLGLRGVVWQRWPQSVAIFQPALDAQNVQQVVAGRISLRVSFNEYSPQVTPETLERVAVDVKRAEDGEIVAQAHYDYTQ